MNIPIKPLFAIIFLFSALVLGSCNEKGEDPSDDPSIMDCTDVDDVKDINTRGACNETLTFTNQVNISVSGGQRIISSNSIPEHKVGKFGMGQGSLNPNAIAPVQDSYTLTANPSIAASNTAVLNTSTGPQYEFGILLNGVLLDPEAAEPWPHEGMMSAATKNWEWNLDAMSINLGLDCNNAHVQPTGKYHHHGSPNLYLQSINAPGNAMTMVGYAADGFPIYYRYAYATANDSTSAVQEMTSSYRLKTGKRPGDGESAPCGEYSGIYTNDYEFVSGLGMLDECNGRTGITPEYPNGTYYYVITESFPFLPRYFKGTPSADFKFR